MSLYRRYVNSRHWAWIYPALAAWNLVEFARDPGGWRWMWLGFAVLFLIETGWRWRERAAIIAIRDRCCNGRDLIVAAAALHANHDWRPLADFDNHRKDER